jgi:ElaB/YqjD/DUF883 family membrane-anchored ribosome-binding protein
METTFDTSSDYRNSKQNLKKDVNALKSDASALKETASDELKNFVADVEDVLKRVTNVSDADVARVRAKIQSAIGSTKEGLFASATQIKDQAQKGAKYADEYVHESPWQAIGIGALLAAAIGASIGYLAARR